MNTITNPIVAIIRKKDNEDTYFRTDGGYKSVALPLIPSDQIQNLFAIVVVTEDGKFLALHSAGRSVSILPKYGPNRKLYQSVMNEFKWSDDRINSAIKLLGDREFATVPYSELDA